MVTNPVNIHKGSTHFQRISADYGLQHPMSVFGTTYYVDSVNGANSNTGKAPNDAVATLAQAISDSSANDMIVIAPGHSETITTAMSPKAGITIIGLGQGTTRPQFTGNLTGDVFNLSNANVSISGLYFNEASAAITSQINVGAAGCRIAYCHFDCGANDVESITIEAAGDELEIANNVFRVTANGPDAAIEIESASVNLLSVHGNLFDGGSDTNDWDNGGIYSAVAHTNCSIKGNEFLYGPAIIFTTTATGNISYNIMGEGTLASMLDPGSCMAFENYDADAVDESGKLVPTAVAT